MPLEQLEQPWLVLLIPLISAAVGYGTNVLAIQMLRYPVEFKGIPPWLGWQGILPANASRLGKHMMAVVEYSRSRRASDLDGLPRTAAPDARKRCTLERAIGHLSREYRDEAPS